MLPRFLIASALAVICSNTLAHDYRVAELQVEHPWSRALPPNAPVGAAYLSVANQGDQADRLVAMSSPIAAKVEMHTMVQAGEVMKMEQLEAIAIPAGEKVVLAPGHNHLMLFGLKKPLVAGEHFPLTLIFEKAGEVEVEVAVESQTPDEHGSH